MNKIDGNTFLISIYGGHLGFQNGRHSISWKLKELESSFQRQTPLLVSTKHMYKV